MCCDALPLTTEAPEMTRDPQTTGALEMTAGALLMVFFSVCACIGAVGAVLFRAYMRRMDALGQQNVALGQKVDALGQKIDVKGENTMEQKGQKIDVKGENTME